MRIQAELNFYPLGTDAVGERVQTFVDGLSLPGISVYPGAMSTVIAGEEAKVFQALQHCFSQSAQAGSVVLCARFSNACPLPGK
ncbi:MAG: thiamine-binding protein [Candidatus Aminicenantes bacterium]|nr:thiamine-binding protein [Candidatus Aminicenantes bacterium]